MKKIKFVNYFLFKYSENQNVFALCLISTLYLALNVNIFSGKLMIQYSLKKYDWYHIAMVCLREIFFHLYLPHG